MKTKKENLLELSHKIIEGNGELTEYLVKNNEFINLVVNFLEDGKAGKMF